MYKITQATKGRPMKMASRQARPRKTYDRYRQAGRIHSPS